MKVTNYSETNFKKFNTHVETWDYSKCSSFEPVKCNRYTDERIPNVMKTLEEGYLPTHSVIVMGRCIKNFGQYKKGDYFRLDGNTRFDVWKIRPDLIPQVDFTVIIYDFDNWSDTKKVYYSLDSMKSVEKAKDLMTGHLRERSYVAKSDIIKKGQFKRAIDIASRYGHNKKGVYLQTSSNEAKLEHYWDVLISLDKMGIDNMGKRRTSGVLAILLMVGKKYRPDNPRFELLFHNLKNGLTTINNSDYVDGVHYVYNDLYTKYSDLWSSSNSYNVNKSPHIITMLYCLDMFMRNENIQKKNKKSIPPLKDLEEFFKYYNERIDD